MAESMALAPNRIHSLPVFVRYHLPSSSQSFSTLFDASQQVYVHASASGEEAWGSIYLKTVVQGVLMASPELHPCAASTADLSLYILDPRETYLRNSRQSPFTSTSSSGHPPSSPARQPPTEVWTGKGLVSWALDEPGEGKNLITGRLVRSTKFASAGDVEGMSPLEALTMMGDRPAWGIEVSVGLRSGNQPHHPPAKTQLASVQAVDRRSSVMSDSSRHASSSPGPSSHHQHHPHNPARPRAAVASLPYRAPTHPPIASARPAIRPLSPSRVVSATPNTKARDIAAMPKRSAGSVAGTSASAASTSSAKRKKPVADRSSRQKAPLGRRPRTSTDGRQGSSSDAEPFPHDIPARLYSDPESLTKEQAERLLESPAFLSMLSKLTGQPIAAGTGTKRPGDATAGPAVKRVKLEAGTAADASGKDGQGDAETLKCWNCGRTKSAVWRMKKMDDGNSVKVCNACGLYWNKMRAMRPPPLWDGVDEDVYRKKKDEEEQTSRASRIDHGARSSSSLPAPLARMTASSPASGSGGFKRTLSAVVNQDAMRIAALKTTSSIGPSSLSQSHKAAPMTSPLRARSIAPSVPQHHLVEKPSVRNTKWNDNPAVAASSPGGWVEPMHPAAPPSDNFNPLPPTPKRQTRAMPSIAEESPNTAIRRILGTDANMPSLDLPLSDDAPSANNNVANDNNGGNNANAFDWGTDLSAFFDVEGYALNHPSNGPVPSIKTETDEDDALSQLFNRTSSAMIESSPSLVPFDFSQLPPSSPPMASDLPHSALLLSSPDLSPLDSRISPASGKWTPSSGKPTPASVVSGLTPRKLLHHKQRQEAEQAEQDKALREFMANHAFDPNSFAGLDELWKLSGEAGGADGLHAGNEGGEASEGLMQSSAGEVEGFLDGGEKSGQQGMMDMFA